VQTQSVRPLAPAPDLSSLDLREQSSAAWSAPCGDTLSGARQAVRTLVGSTIPFIGIAGTTVDDGITIERTRAVIRSSLPR
jgi:hypothetical protein